MDDVTALRNRLERIIPDQSPEFWEEWETRLGEFIAAVEARAIEGSGVVEALVEATSLLPEDAPEPGPYPDMSAVWYERGWDDRGDAILAALSRPEEPRVERCAFVWKSGTPCGKPKRDSRHKHDSSCLTGGEGHITDMLCHPFTPDAPAPDADRLRALEVGEAWLEVEG